MATMIFAILLMVTIFLAVFLLFWGAEYIMLKRKDLRRRDESRKRRQRPHMIKHRVQIPRSIKVGGYDYRIRRSVTDKQAKEVLGSERLWGLTKNDVKEILIDTTTGEQQGLETFMHEYFHAVNYMYVGNKLTEANIQAMSLGFLQITEQLGIRFVLNKDITTHDG